MAEYYRNKETGELFYQAPGGRAVPIQESDIATIEESGFEAFLGSAADTLRQPLSQITSKMDGNAVATQDLADIERRAQVRQFANPTGNIAGNVAGFAPDVVAGAVTGGVAGPLARRMLMTGAVEGAMGGARTGTLEGAALQGGLGMAFPGAAALGNQAMNMTSRVLRGGLGRGNMSSRVTGRIMDVVGDARATAAENAGVRLPRYAGKGRLAKDIGAAIESNPIANVVTGAGRRVSDNAEALSGTAAKSMGQEIGDDGIRGAMQRFQDQAKDFWQNDVPRALDQVDLARDEQFMTQFRQLQETAGQSVTRTDTGEAILKRIDQALEGGTLDGKAISRMRQDLAGFAARTDDATAADAAVDMVGFLDDAIERLAPEGFRAQYQTMRNRYRNFLALDAGRAVNDANEVNARTLTGWFDRQARGKPEPGTNDLYDVASVISGYGDSGVPNSGTATRQLVNQAVPLAIGAAGYGALSN